MDEVSLGKRLQQARARGGLTQQQLCQKAGLSYSTLTKIERGAIKAPSIFTIQQIASVLGTTLDALVGNSPALAQPLSARSRSGIGFIYFDIDGCLVRFYHRAFSRLAEESGAPADLIETTFWHYNDAVCSGKMSLAEFNKIVSKRLSLPDFDWKEYYLDALEPIAEMHKLLRWAAERYKVGLLSNKMPGFVKALEARNLIPDINYNAIIDSSEVGHIKPEREIFEIAQSRTGMNPNEVLLIDDSRTNVMAAEHIGWHVLWFDDFHSKESVARVKDALETA